MYAAPRSSGTIQLLAAGSSSGDGRRIPPFLLVVLCLALFLVAIAAMPRRALAGVSYQLLVRRSQVALTGLTILSGVGVGVVVVLLGT